MISTKPRPSSPRRASDGTRTSSSTSSAVSDERIPSLSSLRDTSNPGRSVSTRNREKPSCPAPRSVRVTSRQKSARTPFVMKVLRPLMT